jgi:hypothetical protein
MAVVVVVLVLVAITVTATTGRTSSARSTIAWRRPEVRSVMTSVPVHPRRTSAASASVTCTRA